jgi:UTP--glucose-1-phosphate uridylyltransferase
MHKEMLPVVDKPAIQYVVEEAVAAGITDVLMVTGRNKRPLEDHFDRVDGLEAALQAKGDVRKLDLIRESSELADIHFVRQGDPLGLGHAVLKGEHHVEQEPFAVLLGDDLIDERSPVLPDMIDAYGRTGGSVIALMEVPQEAISMYGCAAVEATEVDGLVRVTDLVEKPDAADAPSNLAVIGRYVLSPEIFPLLHRTEPGRGNEIQLTDALKEQARGDGHGVYGVIFTGERYDTGDKLSYIQAVIQLASRRDDLGADLRAWLREFVAGLDD